MREWVATASPTSSDERERDSTSNIERVRERILAVVRGRELPIFCGILRNLMN